MNVLSPELIQACLRGDRTAQRGVYETYYSLGMSVATRYCDDRDQAVAVLHDAFLKAFRKLDRYDPALPFGPWFKTLVVRAALDHLKRNRAHARHVSLEDTTPAPAREDILSRIGYQELTAMIRRLSAGYRAVFNLHVIDGLRHEEIAEQLGISVGASKSNLHKARARLRVMVENSLAVKTAYSVARSAQAAPADGATAAADAAALTLPTADA